MNNFTKCCSSAKGLQKKGITTLMLFMFLALTSLSYGQGLGVDPLGGGEEIGDINECMHDVPAMKSVADLMVPGYFNGYFDACQDSNDFVINPVAADYGSDNPNMPQYFNGEWGKKTGFSKGSTHCNWIFYYVYSVKCAGEVTPFTVKYSGGDATAPSVPKANKAAYNALVADKLDLNLCFDDRPTAPTAAQIAALYTDNCDHVKVSGELVSKRTKTKNDDCGWTEIHVYTVQDYCESNAFEFSITYTGSDHDAPVFNQKAIEGLKDITVDCDKIPDAVSIPYTDNCAPNGKAKLYDEVSTIVKGEECAGGTIERWWKATDECGNNAWHKQTITVRPALQAQFNEPLDMSISCEDKNNLESLIPDLYYTNGMQGDCNISGTAKPQYTATDLDCGSFLVEYFFTDACGRVIKEEMTVTIFDDENPAVLNAAEDLTVECDGAGNIEDYMNWVNNNANASAQDNCTATEDLVWTNNAASQPMSDDCGETGQKTVIFTVTDSCGNQSKTYATFKIVDTLDPVYTPAYNQTVVCDGAGNVDQFQVWLDDNAGATAKDDCSGVTWTNDFPGNPKSKDFDISQYLVDGCSTYTGYINVTFTATDACGNDIQTAATFTIEDSIKPEMTPASDMTVECDGTIPDIWKIGVEYAQDALDAQQGAFYPGTNAYAAYMWLKSHGGATATDGCSNVHWKFKFIGVYGDSCDTEYKVTFYAYDDCHNVSTSTATFHIEDTNSPAIGNEAQDMIVECGANDVTCSIVAGPHSPFDHWLHTNAGAEAMDMCDKTLTWSNDYDGKGLTDECGATGRVTVTFTVTDNCGLSSSTAAEYRIVDTTAPDLTVPADAHLNYDDKCDADITPANTGMAEAWDACGIPAISFTDVTDKQACLTTITRTWKATDECGNVTSKDQIIKIHDVTAPELVGMLSDLNISNMDACEAPAPPTLESVAAMFHDACGYVVVELLSTNVISDSACDWAVQYHYAVADNCGNYYDGTVKVTHWGSDQTAPNLVAGAKLPAGVSDINACLADAIDANPPLDKDTVLKLFEDNCSSTLYFDYERTDTDVDCTWAFHYTYYVYDECGADNTFSFKQYFSGEDKTAPVLVGAIPQDMSDLDACKDTYSAPDVSGLFKDSCGLNIDVTTHRSGTDCNWINSFEYVVTDNCGNAYPTFKVTYQGGDQTDPVITSGPLDADFAYSETPVFADVDEVTAIDNCDNDVAITKLDSAHSHEVGTPIPGDSEWKLVYRYWHIIHWHYVTIQLTENGTLNGAPYYEGIEKQYGTQWGTRIFRLYLNPHSGPTTQDYHLDVKDSPADTTWQELLISQNGLTDAPCSTNQLDSNHIHIRNVRSISCNTPDQSTTVHKFIRTFTATDDCGNTDVWPVNYSYVTPDNQAPDGDVLPVVDDYFEDMFTPSTDEDAASAAAAAPDTELSFQAYPVPFNQDVTVKYNFEFDTEVTVEVYDTKGLLVLSKKAAYKAGGDATMPLRINGADQMYYVKLITNKGTITKKVLASKL